jgi:hypothetical protein
MHAQSHARSRRGQRNVSVSILGFVMTILDPGRAHLNSVPVHPTGPIDLHEVLDGEHELAMRRATGQGPPPVELGFGNRAPSSSVQQTWQRD